MRLRLDGAGTRVMLVAAGWVFALGAVCASLPLRTSEHPAVLGRWSLPYAAFLLAANVALLAAAGLAARRRTGAHQPSRPGVVAAFGVAVTGLAYLVGSLERPASASRLLHGALFDSVSFVAPLLEWLGLALLVAAAGAKLWRSAPERWRAPLLMLASVTLVGICSEVVARLVAVTAPAVQGYPTYRHELWFRRYVRLNALGFRDGEWTIAKEAGTRRLLVVGDSYAFGQGVDDVGDLVSSRIARGLAGRAGRWQVLNAGLTDVNTLDQIRMLERLRPFEPDFVLLLYVFNDADYLIRGRRTGAREPTSGLLDRLRPTRLLFLNSHAWQQLLVHWRAMAFALRRPGPGRHLYGDSALLHRHLVDLARLQRLATLGGASFAVVPFDVAVVADSNARARYQLFSRAADRAGLPVWRADDAFDGRPLEDLTVNRLDRHPSALAHRMLADRILSRLGKEPAP